MVYRAWLRTGRETEGSTSISEVGGEREGGWDGRLRFLGPRRRGATGGTGPEALPTDTSDPCLYRSISSRDEQHGRTSSPPQDLQIHLESVLANSIEHGVHSPVETFTACDLEDLFDDVDGAVEEETVLSTRFEGKRCLLLRRGGANNVRSEVLSTME
jgi:hypothetical protein